MVDYNKIGERMVTDLTGVMQHIYQPGLSELQEYIPASVLDVTDPLRTINPYWALYNIATDKKEQQAYLQSMLQRMDAIRSVAQEDNILYVENIYVREDFRRRGVCRMLLDLLKEEYGDCITWLNMEPTTGGELNHEYGHMLSYTASELGQLNINAAIAEQLGFTVDPDTWHIQADCKDEEGNITVRVLEVRKCAYHIPKKIREIIKDDGDLVAIGRAKQKLLQQDQEGHCEVDMRDGYVDGHLVYEQKIQYRGGKNHGKVVFVYSAVSEQTGKVLYGVSARSPLDHGIEHDGITEQYHKLEEAVSSEYYSELEMVDALLPRLINEDIMAEMDMYDEDSQYLMGFDEAGNGIVILSVKPTKGKWVSTQLYGAAHYMKSEESVRFEISRESYQDVMDGNLSQEEYDDSVLENYLSEDGSLPLPDKTDFYLMYAQMQELIIQQIMENCQEHNNMSDVPE